MDRRTKRIPLGEITGKLALNRKPERVLKPDLLKNRHAKSPSHSINLASLTRSYLQRETQTRTRSSIDEITRQISLRSETDHVEPRVARRVRTFSGVLTDQVNDILTNIHSMNAVLGYDQPLTTEKLSTVDILELGEVSPQLRIVRLDSNELVALACFKPSFNIKIKPNDHIHLGNAYYTISLPETNLKCYYRWYKVIKR